MNRPDSQGEPLPRQRVRRPNGIQVYPTLQIGKTHTQRRKSTSFLSACQVESEREDSFKSPDYFKSMESEDPDLYHAILESLRMATGDPEYYPHHSDMKFNILDIAKPSKTKKCAQAEKPGKIKQSSIQDSYQTLKDVPEEEFEIWEDDIFERSMSDSEDDWEEVLDEQKVGTLRPSYSTALRGNNNNG